MRFFCGILLGWFAHLYSGDIMAVVNRIIGQVQ